ncbi:Pyridoxamine 5'-phosphate oxidase [Paenibacillus sp. yr247]|uniref:pyridoxamine 5'-phosphate oxidase family protein n=1 Tax=Paenibacillus sp. yr247 TaxID=1761880 RepID=UPI00088E1D7B|nr:pyridoxamine 5'-phosphate oxidase family protein [Paenibacillus sp. yr247]SDP16734.1 Pyridoxamine 5'-phosphate oxidase [Paenibacillus sp. yr247]
MGQEKTILNFKDIFEKERMGFLTTFNKLTGNIHHNVVSWIAGVNQDTLRIAVSSKSDIVSNIESHPNVSFSFFFDEKVMAFQCEAIILTKEMKEVPFPLTLIELSAQQTEDIMFYGARISQEPVFEKTYNLKAAKQLDMQVYDSMMMGE